MAVEAHFVDFDEDLTPPGLPAGARRHRRTRLMDFTFTAEQDAVAEAAEGIFGSLVTPDRVAEVEATEDRVDAGLWSALAAADLLGLAVPEDLGGQGLGLTELCLLLEAQGRCVAPVPLWPTLVLGALPLSRFGTAGQAAQLAARGGGRGGLLDARP